MLDENAKSILGDRPIILCIGSDRVTGDCLGPLVGHMLIRAGVNAYVYGSLAHPVTALNLTSIIAAIKLRHGSRKILAVDSSVGVKSDVGKINVFIGALKPGSADGKRLPHVGDVSITATVTDLRRMPLNAVRLGEVYALADEISTFILDAYPPKFKADDTRLPFSTLYN